MASNLKPLILHAHSSGPNPVKVAILLEALGIPYEVKLWQYSDDANNGVKGAAFVAINENGRVPALEDPNTGIVSWESMACINYVLRVYDQTNRYGPADSEQARVDADKWTSFMITTLGPMLGQVRYWLAAHPTRDEDALKRYTAQVYRCFDVLEGHLQRAKTDFILPQGFSALDMHFYPWMERYPHAGLSLDGYPAVKAWYDRVAARAEVKQAYARIASGTKM